MNPTRSRLRVDAAPEAIAGASVIWSAVTMIPAAMIGWSVATGAWAAIPAPAVIAGFALWTGHRDVLTRCARLARFRFGQRW